jgi:hypothetical protein
MTMMGMRRAARARMQRVIKRAEARQVIAAPAPSQLDQARIDKWIRDRLVATLPGSCWCCRRPFTFSQKFIDVRGAEVVVRFHQQCESEWRIQQESAARRALGLERATKESDHG